MSWSLPKTQGARPSTPAGHRAPTRQIRRGSPSPASSARFPGAGASPINVAGDLYVATRGDSGWNTRYIGPSSSEVGCAGGRPQVSGAGFATTIQNDVMADSDLGRVIDWNLGNPDECLWGRSAAASGQWIQHRGAGVQRSLRLERERRQPRPLADFRRRCARFGRELRLPPGPRSAPLSPGRVLGNVPVAYFCSTFVMPPKTSTTSSSRPRPDIYGGAGSIGVAPGSAYDNNTADDTLSLISIKPNLDPIGQEQPNNGGPERVDPVPLGLLGWIAHPDGHGGQRAVQAGRLRLRSGVGQLCPIVNQPTHLYMRVNNALSYDVSAGRPVHYVEPHPTGPRSTSPPMSS